MVKRLLQCGRPGFNPWVGKISWRRKWQPTLVFLPGKSHRCRSLVGYSSWGCKESDTTERLHLCLHSPNAILKIFSVQIFINKYSSLTIIIRQQNHDAFILMINTIFVLSHIFFSVILGLQSFPTFWFHIPFGNKIYSTTFKLCKFVQLQSE